MRGSWIVVGVLGPLAKVLAQTTWIVNAGGGAGVHFTDVVSAVAAAADGDTIVVQTGPFGEGAVPFTTNKGLTIVGSGGQVPIVGSAAQPVVVNGLPAGRTFRLVGFRRPVAGELNVHVLNCAGAVHLESLQAAEPDSFFPAGPSIVVDNSLSVTMRAVETFGSPAVQVTSSRVVMTSCRLGVTSLGLGGGPCLYATNAAIDIAQPRFDAAWHAAGAVVATNSTLRIGGDGSALLAGGSGMPIAASGGTVTRDPAVPMPGVPSGVPVSGTATVTVTAVPGTRTLLAAFPGSAWGTVTTAPPGAVVFQALGDPGILLPSPLGTLGIDVAAPYGFFPPMVVTLTGSVTNIAVIPVATPRGTAWATQSVVWDGVTLQLGAPVTFVVH